VHPKSCRNLAAFEGEGLGQLSGDDALTSDVVPSVSGDEVPTDLDEPLIGNVAYLEARLSACAG
jgi:hypothetical protein